MPEAVAHLTLPKPRMRFIAILLSCLIIWTNTAFGQDFYPEVEITESIPTPLQPTLIDMDGDGLKDLVTMSILGGKIAVRQNLGGLTFGKEEVQTRIVDNYNPLNWLTADFNNDGLPDVAYVGFADIGVFLNAGDGSFETESLVTTDLAEFTAMAALDVDNDGWLDLVASKSFSGDELRWYRNLEGSGDFEEYQVISDTLPELSILSAADVNGDGALDLFAYAPDPDDILLWLTDAEGLLGNPMIISSAFSGVTAMSFGDINGDDTIDMVVSRYNDDIVCWQSNDGDGNFSGPIIISNDANNTREVQLSDIDQDGDLDLVSMENNSLGSWTNDGAGGFSNYSVIDDTTIGQRFATTGDLDNDGILEIVAAGYGINNDDYVRVYPGLPGGSFGNGVPVVVQPDFARGLVCLDFDEDGDLDFVVSAAQSDAIFLIDNLGDGNFSAVQPLISDLSNSEHLIVEDINLDGSLDIVTGTSSGSIQAYLNNGDNTFGGVVWIENFLSGVEALEYEDINGDGFDDILALNAGTNPIVWYPGDGTGDFGEEEIVADFVGFEQDMFTSDLDYDGDLDIVVAYGDDIEIYRNLGAGVFSEPENHPIQDVRSVAAQDMNGDGFKDILFCATGNDSNSLGWLANLGVAEFDNVPIYIEGFVLSQLRDVQVQDMDEDNIDDLLIQSNIHLVLLKGDGAGEFAPADTLMRTSSLVEVLVQDFDGDDDLDILFSDVLEDKVSWLSGAASAGCMDSSACNYDPTAIEPADNCCFAECGCDDPIALNYDPSATCPDTSCEYVEGCQNPFATNYNFSATSDDGSCLFQLSVRVFNDLDQDGLDDAEPGLAGSPVTLSPSGMVGFTNDEGYVEFNDLPADDYFVSASPLSTFSFSTTSSTVFVPLGIISVPEILFGKSAEAPSYDIDVNLYAEGQAYNCEESTSHNVTITNTSNVALDFVIAFEFDPLFTFIEAGSSADSVVANIAYFSQLGIPPSQTNTMAIDLITPSVDFIGSFLPCSVTVTGFELESEVAFGEDAISHELTCAYDPNDKQVFPPGYSDEHYIAVGQDLEYLIRFQNTGNAPATNIHVLDTIDVSLDLETFNLIAQSHSVMTTIDHDSRVVDFFFENIMLPDSVNNEPESHGFVSFEIDQVEGLPLLSTINNFVDIYFDNNPPIQTNTTWSTLYDCSLFTAEITVDGSTLTASAGDAYQWYLNGDPIEGAVNPSIEVGSEGEYAVEVSTGFPCTFLTESVFVVGIPEVRKSTATLYPNPISETAILDLGVDFHRVEHVAVYDIQGRLHRTLELGAQQIQIHRDGLQAGQYLIEISSGAETERILFQCR